MKGVNRHQSSEMRLPTCVARFEDGQMSVQKIECHGTSLSCTDPPLLHRTPKPTPFGSLAPPLQFTAPELHDWVKVKLIHEGGSVVRGNSPRMPTEPAVMYQVLAGAVHAVRNASV